MSIIQRSPTLVIGPLGTGWALGLSTRSIPVEPERLTTFTRQARQPCSTSSTGLGFPVTLLTPSFPISTAARQRESNRRCTSAMARSPSAGFRLPSALTGFLGQGLAKEGQRLIQPLHLRQQRLWLDGVDGRQLGCHSNPKSAEQGEYTGKLAHPFILGSG